MLPRHFIGIALLCSAVVVLPRQASAQIVEAVGSRALGMGGAFVAVASDASATWWNPGGLAAGPFLDMSLSRAVTETADGAPAWRHRTSGFAIGTPPLGFGYYRFRLTDIQPFRPTEQDPASREDRGVGLPVRSLSASQVGVTIVQSLVSGLHAGTTLKYVRGTIRTGLEDAGEPGDLLDVGEELESGNAEGRFDLDVGVLATAGSLRLGAVVRNVREPEFDGVRLARQFRAGIAFDPERATGVPLTIALDADLRQYETVTGSRRVVAAGAEQWFASKRFGVRAGARVNTVGRRERTATAGATVLMRAGLYVEGHVVRGGSAGEEGWGLATRVSF